MIIKKFVKILLYPLKYIIIPNSVRDMFIPKKKGLYKYKNYEEYKQAQIKGNIRKLVYTWASENNIKYLSGYLKKEVPNLKFGICHGTRRGKEQEWFHKHLGIKVIGTEISPTAKQFPNTIQWDFHDVKDEWIDNVDFIYSNSFDHSYKPEECLDAWMSCIKKQGVCILEWNTGNINYSKLDPFGGTLEDYKKLITKKYKIKDILKKTNSSWYKPNKIYFLIICHKNNR